MDLPNEDKSPEWKPTFKRRWLVYTLICISTIIQGMITAGFVNTSFTTIERKFHFSSTTTGFISGAAPLGSLIFIIPWSHLSDHKGASKLHYFGAGLFTMAIGSLCYCLPHFVSTPVARNTQSSLSNNNICMEGSEPADKIITENFAYGVLFFIGNFLHGAGSSCFFPIGAAYLSAIIKDSPGLITLWTALFVVGPALGYAVGGQLLRVDTDIDRKSSLANQQVLEEQWLGAWWIAFVLSAITCFVLSAIYFGGNSWLSKKISEPDSSEQQPRDPVRPEPTNVLRQMWEQVKKLPGDIHKMLKLKVYVLVLIFLASDGTIITSLAAFLPKYLETQFSYSSSDSATWVGGLVVASALIGTQIGNKFQQKYSLGLTGCIKLYIISQSLTLIFGLGFFFYCPQTKFSGITHSQPVIKSYYNVSDLSIYCNSNCPCAEQGFQPVCGDDNVRYYNPCFAGCQRRTESGDYEDCACVNGPDGAAFNRTCESDCINDTFFLISIFVTMILLFLPTKPILTIISDSAEDEGSLPLAVQGVAYKILGTIPGPIVFGKVIDLTCLLFSPQSCVVYENLKLATYTMVFVTAAKAMGVFVATIAHHYSIRRIKSRK